MREKVNNLIISFINKSLTFEQLKKEIRKDAKNPELYVKGLFEEIIEYKDYKCLETALYILWDLEKDQEFIDILHCLLLEDWHTQYENIIHDLQYKANPLSVPYIKKSMMKKYNFLESYGTGTRQFINQCGHTLVDIGTQEAIDVIYELANSQDPVLRDEMLYRIDSIEGKYEYERNFDL